MEEENLSIINNYIIIIRNCKSAKVTYVWRRRILALLMTLADLQFLIIIM
jgi:hypothetical protein